MSVTVVYRYWHPGNNDHFYTTNAGEIGTTTQGQSGNHGYQSEGSGFTVFTHPHHGLVPIYRYWHAGNHDHFYTANAGEIGTTTQGQTGNHGYQCEGILGYLSPNEFPGSAPIYRYWKDDTHDHFYTTNAAELELLPKDRQETTDTNVKAYLDLLIPLTIMSILYTATGRMVLTIISILLMLLKLERPLMGNLETTDTSLKELHSTSLLTIIMVLSLFTDTGMLVIMTTFIPLMLEKLVRPLKDILETTDTPAREL